MAGVTRKQMLEQIADKFLENGSFPTDALTSLPGCTDVHAELSGDRRQVNFSATWPDITYVTSRPFKEHCE